MPDGQVERIGRHQLGTKAQSCVLANIFFGFPIFACEYVCECLFNFMGSLRTAVVYKVTYTIDVVLRFSYPLNSALRLH